MLKAQSLKRVPWTCKWGQFGGPVPPLDTPVAGFVFWMCGHPGEPAPRPLTRDSCGMCPNWELPEDPDA